MSSGTVYVVHCIDTEGPLHESIEATFERMRDMFGLDLEPSAVTLQRLQAGDYPLGGLEDEVRRFVDPRLLSYNDTWEKIDEMLDDCMSSSFRRDTVDSDGEGWVYNWFCVDHVDYEVNPRRRDIGYHNVFDHYQSVMAETGSLMDGLHFHYHPHNFRREAHRCATRWWGTSDTLDQSLSRRVIDRQWFPAVNRPGFHAIRPDSHWFLEQYIPFDYSNQAVSALSADGAVQSGDHAGRYGDWRRAPASWAPYHPSHDDYQNEGDCRRWVCRCLNVGTRLRLLSPADVRQAFMEAREGLPVILAFTDHDHRDIRPDVHTVREYLKMVSTEFPDVRFAFSEAVAAMRGALALSPELPCSLDMNLRESADGSHVLSVATDTPTFGPQPWLAFKTNAGNYYHDNFDIDTPFRQWEYVFDPDTFPIRAIEKIGVGAANSYGVTTVSLLDPSSGQALRRVWNA